MGRGRPLYRDQVTKDLLEARSGRLQYSLVQDLARQLHLEPDPIKVASYLIWRLNWIHPFGGGNGRTSRALAELSLRVRLANELPGKTTLPEQIVKNRRGRSTRVNAPSLGVSLTVVGVRPILEVRPIFEFVVRPGTDGRVRWTPYRITGSELSMVSPESGGSCHSLSILIEIRSTMLHAAYCRQLTSVRG